MNVSAPEIWLLIALLGVGTFLIRFSFLGLVGDRQFPDWLLKMLRYTPVAVLPGLVAPLVLFPAATGGHPDLPRGAAAVTTLAVGYFTRNTLLAILAGAGVLYSLLWVAG